MYIVYIYHAEEDWQEQLSFDKWWFAAYTAVKALREGHRVQILSPEEK